MVCDSFLFLPRYKVGGVGWFVGAMVFSNVAMGWVRCMHELKKVLL